MDHVEVAVVASPLAALAPLYDVDPDADVLLIVPPSQAFKLQEKPHYVNGINGINGDHKPTNGKPSPTQSGLRLKVSSKHLALASRVFKSKLSFGTSDTVRQSDGRVHLQLGKGFGPQAVIIVMNAVHSRGSKVPRTVDIETLAQIALFVDRFQLLDAVEVYAERWISKLENGIPNIYNQDLVRWIYISHVFRHAEIFKAATKTAAAQSSGPIDTLGLPIREKILHHIDTTRQTLLSLTLTHLHNTLDTLTSNTVAPCPTHHCDSLLLGELIKSLHAHRLVWPRPAKPFPGISFAAVVAGVRSGLTLHHQRKEERRQREVEPWYMRSANSPAKEGPRPGWGVVGGIFPVTPAASPEPVYRAGGGAQHECEAWRVVGGLDGLERVVEGVEGLVLEGRLGYRAY